MDHTKLHLVISTNISRILFVSMMAGLISACTTIKGTDALIPSSTVSNINIEPTPQLTIEIKTDLINLTPTSIKTPTPTFAPILNESTPQFFVTNSDLTSERYDPFLKWPEIAGEEVIIHYDFSRMSTSDVYRLFETSGSDLELDENGLVWITGGQQSQNWIRPDSSILNSIDNVSITKILIYYSLHKSDTVYDDKEVHYSFFPESSMFIDFSCEIGPKSDIIARVSTGATLWLLSMDFEPKQIWDSKTTLAKLEDQSETYFIELFPYNTSNKGEQSFFGKQILLEYDDSPLNFSGYISTLDDMKTSFTSSAKVWDNFDCSNPKLDKIGFFAKFESGYTVRLKNLYIIGTKK